MLFSADMEKDMIIAAPPECTHHPTKNAGRHLKSLIMEQLGGHMNTFQLPEVNGILEVIRFAFHNNIVPKHVT